MLLWAIKTGFLSAVLIWVDLLPQPRAQPGTPR